jgi:hypothetical protein
MEIRMPKLTNKLNYPSPIVRAVRENFHKPEEGIFGITSLCDSPTVRHYRINAWDDIVVDADDFLWAMFGTAFHQYLSKYVDSRAASEESLIMRLGDAVVRGQLDMREQGILSDFKVTSAWSFVFGKESWHQQLNMYSLLCEANDRPINRLFIQAFLRDWTQTNAWRYSPQYPKKKFFKVEIPLWSKERRMQFVRDRLADHKKGPRPCTAEERWQAPTKWAVMKQGVKTARKVCDTQDDAKAWIGKQKNADKLSIIKRPGGCRRCSDYCFVRSVCEYKGDI